MSHTPQRHTLADHVTLERPYGTARATVDGWDLLLSAATRTQHQTGRETSTNVVLIVTAAKGDTLHLGAVRVSTPDGHLEFAWNEPAPDGDTTRVEQLAHVAARSAATLPGNQAAA